MRRSGQKIRIARGRDFQQIADDLMRGLLHRPLDEFLAAFPQGLNLEPVRFYPIVYEDGDELCVSDICVEPDCYRLYPQACKKEDFRLDAADYSLMVVRPRNAGFPQYTVCADPGSAKSLQRFAEQRYEGRDAFVHVVVCRSEFGTEPEPCERMCRSMSKYLCQRIKSYWREAEVSTNIVDEPHEDVTRVDCPLPTVRAVILYLLGEWYEEKKIE